MSENETRKILSLSSLYVLDFLKYFQIYISGQMSVTSFNTVREPSTASSHIL